MEILNKEARFSRILLPSIFFWMAGFGLLGYLGITTNNKIILVLVGTFFGVGAGSISAALLTIGRKQLLSALTWGAIVGIVNTLLSAFYVTLLA